MRGIITMAAAAALAACAGPVSVGGAPASGGWPGGGGGAGGSAGGGGRADVVAEMARLVNAHRASRGCPALVWLQPAADAAEAHSADMARRGYFDHVSPDGQRPWDRLAARGVRYRLVAENIAYTPGQDARATLAGWLNSRGHRENLENCAYTHHGIGLESARWTHVFVTPVAAP